MSLGVIAALFMVALVGGCVDAIAGGGGLLCLPSLLWAGLSPSQSLATNKMQSCFGICSATVHFYRAGLLDVTPMRPMILSVFGGALAGTLLVQQIDPAFLRSVLPFLLAAIAVYFLAKPSLGAADRSQRVGFFAFGLTAAPFIGFYDGFFGPGAGSFYTVALVELLGFSLTRATAHAKLLNLTSNFAAVLAFLLGGQIQWMIALVMAVGQVIGGRLGSQLVVRKGASLVRPLLVVMSLALTVKLVAGDPQNWAHRLVADLWQ